MSVLCPVCREYTFTYDEADVEALANESPIGIEYTNGWNLLSVIEFPLREHVRTDHPHDVARIARQRWWL